MPEPSEREAFRNLLIDYWAIRTAEKLGDVSLPDAEMLEKYREIATAQADKVLQSYERELQVDKLTDSVIERLRDDLVPRSRAARLIEVAINVSALVIGGAYRPISIYFRSAGECQANISCLLCADVHSNLAVDWQFVPQILR